jgi:hypothetical protein
MQPNNNLTAHQLAEILLRGEDYSVVIPAANGLIEANFIQDIYLYQKSDSPFEYCLLLSSKSSTIPDDELEIPD